MSAPLDALKATIEQALHDHLPPSATHPPHLAPSLVEAMRYSALGGGKRLRAMLVCAAGTACGATLNNLLPAACAVECVHAYSLIHDDLPAMDNDNMRHGKPSCHCAFDEATAILAGDALLTLAFELIARSPGTSQAKLAAVTELATASGWAGMVGGQSFDMAVTGTQIPQDALEALHRAKTGALIRAAVRIGALLAGADASTLSHLSRFAEHTGLAFQVIDDVLDVTATSEALGKPAGSDVRQEKSTFVTLMGVEASRAYAEDLLMKALSALEASGLKEIAMLEALALRLVRRSF